MRAEKRVKYGEREDKRLVKMLKMANDLKEQDGSNLLMKPSTVLSWIWYWLRQVQLLKSRKKTS